MITEKGFLIKNTEEIRKEIIDDIRANNLIRDADFENESSLINQFTTIISDKMAKQYRVMSDVYNSNFIQFAIGDNLNNVALSYGMERHVSRQQTISVEMKIKLPIDITEDETIPRGYGIEISGNKFKSLEEVFFEIGFPDGTSATDIKSYSFNSILYNNLADLNGLTFYNTKDNSSHSIVVDASNNLVTSLPSFLTLDSALKRINLKKKYTTRDYLVRFDPSKNLNIFLNVNFISDEKKHITITENSLTFKNLSYIDNMTYLITTIEGRSLETDQELRERIFELFFPLTINTRSLQSKLEGLEGVISSNIDVQSSGTYIYVDGGYFQAIVDLIEQNLIWNQILLHNTNTEESNQLTINSSNGIEIKFNRPNIVTGLNLRIISVINTDSNSTHDLSSDVKQFIANDMINYLREFKINQDFIVDQYLARVYNYFNVNNLIINTGFTQPSGNNQSFFNVANNSVIKEITIS